MKLEQSYWTQTTGWLPDYMINKSHPDTDWVLIFGSAVNIGDPERLAEISKAYPNALLSGCSTAGEIIDTNVMDDTLTLTAINFDDTKVKSVCQHINDISESFECGSKLAQAIPHEGLRHVLVLSDGLIVNGSELVKGISKHLPSGIAVTGGLSADGTQFKNTLVINDKKAINNSVSLIGFYGESLQIGYGSLGGWDAFGPERLITRSEGNVLFEMDGKSALELYKQYLGKHADGLPATGLLFPLELRTSDNKEIGKVRILLSVDEDKQSLTFGGDIPEGSYVRLMKSNFNRLMDGAIGAAENSKRAIKNANPELALLISCVGRKMILKQRTEDEIEAVRDTLGSDTVFTGFYSYGELSPSAPGANCELQNQTMTITTFSEK